jgi:hypothetical protein
MNLKTSLQKKLFILIFIGILFTTFFSFAKTAKKPVNTSKVNQGRKIASYSDADIIENEISKQISKILKNTEIKSYPLDAKRVNPIIPIYPSLSCDFGPKDYWSMVGLEGGCGPNKGNMEGKTNANQILNYKINCTIRAQGINKDNCAVLGALEFDGFNTCQKPTPTLPKSSLNSQSQQRLDFMNTCLSPDILNKMKNDWLSIQAPENYKIIEIHIGGYPNINCAGVWGVTLLYGQCDNNPQINFKK